MDVMRTHPMVVIGGITRLPVFEALLVEFLRAQDRAVEPFSLYPQFKRGRWHWTEDDQFDIEHHFRHSALPRPGRIVFHCLTDRALRRKHLIEGDMEEIEEIQ